MQRMPPNISNADFSRGSPGEVLPALYLIFIKILSSVLPFTQVPTGPRQVLIYSEYHVYHSSFCLLALYQINVHSVLDLKTMTQKLETN